MRLVHKCLLWNKSFSEKKFAMKKSHKSLPRKKTNTNNLKRFMQKNCTIKCDIIFFHDMHTWSTFSCSVFTCTLMINSKLPSIFMVSWQMESRIYKGWPALKCLPSLLTDTVKPVTKRAADVTEVMFFQSFGTSQSMLESVLCVASVDLLSKKTFSFDSDA